MNSSQNRRCNVGDAENPITKKIVRTRQGRNNLQTYRKHLLLEKWREISLELTLPWMTIKKNINPP